MNENFGRRLRHYRKQADLSQRELANELSIARRETISNTRISKWEHGQVPSTDMVQDLEDILKCRGELLRASGKVVGPPTKEQLEMERAMHDHLRHLAGLAVMLLANELDTVSTVRPDLLPGEAEPKEWGMCKYWIGEGNRQGLEHDRALSELLLQNWRSVARSHDQIELDCFMSHVAAEFPLLRRRHRAKSVRALPHIDAFEYLRINLPYSLIERLRALADTERFKGTCRECGNWPRP